MEFSFNGKITFDDYINYCKFMSKKYEKMLYIVLITCIVVNLAINSKEFFDNISFQNSNINNLEMIAEGNNVSIDILYGKSNIITFIITFFSSIVIIIFSLSFILIRKHIKYKNYKKNYESNKLMKEDNIYKITEEEITIKNNFENIILNKENIYNIKYNINSIYIFISTNSSYIIKNNFFNDENNFNELIIFLKEKYEKR
jgi:hypothetical protein